MPEPRDPRGQAGSPLDDEETWSEPTGGQSFLPEGSEPGQRGGPAGRGPGEPGPVLRSSEEIAATPQDGPTPPRRGERS